MYHHQFARPQIGQITLLRFTKTQTIKTIQYFTQLFHELN